MARPSSGVFSQRDCSSSGRAGSVSDRRSSSGRLRSRLANETHPCVRSLVKTISSPFPTLSHRNPFLSPKLGDNRIIVGVVSTRFHPASHVFLLALSTHGILALD